MIDERLDRELTRLKLHKLGIEIDSYVCRRAREIGGLEAASREMGLEVETIVLVLLDRKGFNGKRVIMRLPYGDKGMMP